MTNFPTPLARPTPLRVATVTLCFMLGGCTVVGDWWGSEKTDYKGQSKRTQPLEVPPDLTQLQKDSRYAPQAGTISASEIANGASAPAGGEPAVPGAPGTPSTPQVALDRINDVHMVRLGNQRWLSTTESPDTVWPKIHDFWVTRGYTFIEDDPKTGILATDWKEDRSKLPSDFVHDMLGKVASGLFDTGLRDRYRTRLERSPDGGTEVYLTQYGATEELVGFQKSETQWFPAPNDPSLEAQRLDEMMLALGGVPDAALAAEAGASAPAGAASAAVAGAAAPEVNPANARARIVSGQPGATLQMDESFDRSWRRVGLTLDHGGFTVEDRDRAQGLYFVRFVDAREAAKEENGLLTKIKGWFGAEGKSPVGKYRILIKAAGDNSCTVAILDDQGQPSNDENAKRIVQLLVDDLK